MEARWLNRRAIDDQNDETGMFHRRATGYAGRVANFSCQFFATSDWTYESQHCYARV